ncbi:MAG: NAD(P)H-dependent oxidoreductase [Bryobacteraceae bacterium]
MKVLTIFAHPGQRSFCRSVLERFDAGLKDAGHTNEIVDLYAIGFDPVLRERDNPNWMDPDAPDDIIAKMNLRERMLEGARGPLRRFAVNRLIGDLDSRGIIRLLQQRYRPKDVAVQQQKVANAQALAFIAPVYFVGFPAMLKGWIERVFTLGFAFGLTAEAWRGDINGRLPLLEHEKALIIQPTIFDQRAYDAGIRDAMTKTIDEWGLLYPGVKSVEHVYFYAVHGADEKTIGQYLDRAYRLGREF